MVAQHIYQMMQMIRKTKIVAKINDFIKEYTGENLQNTVLSDVNHCLRTRNDTFWKIG